jgi:hypothetical protein
MTPGESQERKHKLEQINGVDSGEYELLGNDGVTRWFIYRYEDLGTGSRGMFAIDLWGVRRQNRRTMWVKFGDGYPRRKDAITAILKAEEPPQERNND